MRSTQCTGISAGNYDLYKCSGVADPGGSMVCANQCCYYNSEMNRSVCLAPPAIGLVNSEYDKACAFASRDIFQEVTDLQNRMNSMKQKFDADLSTFK